jgi:ERCC4-type nuclease
MSSILIDSNEPETIKKLGTVQHLTVGDAWIATPDAVLVIERKTLSDFCASITDHRLFNQVAEMRQISPWCYVVVCGIPAVAGGKIVIGGRPSGWQWASVQGAMLTVQELGAVLIWIESDMQYAACLEWLEHRDRGAVQIAARRDVSLESPAEQVLTALPGIAQVRAAALLAHCGSVAFALQYLTAGEEHIPGIGAATKNAVRSVLGLPADMRLAVILKEDVENE